MRVRSLSVACLLALVACGGKAQPPVATSPSPSPSEAPKRVVEDFSFSGRATGWALVEECAATCTSVVYATRDGGASWRRTTPIGASDLEHVVRGSDTVGWAYAGSLFETRDGGRTWKEQPIQAPALSARGRSVWRIRTVDPAGGIFEVSGDLGRTWKKGTGPRRLSVENEIVRVDDARAYITTQGGDSMRAIFGTTDGGKAWHEIKNRCAGSRYVDDHVAAWGDSLWLACGTESGENKPQSTITWRSRDGGAHWAIPYPGPESSGHFRFALSHPEVAWMTLAGSPVGASENAGRTWGTRLTFEDNSSWGPIAFVDSSHGWIAHGDQIFRTTDAGKRWTRVALP